MGKYGQFCGQISTTNNFAKLFASHLIVEAYRATLHYLFGKLITKMLYDLIDKYLGFGIQSDMWFDAKTINLL